MKIHIIICKKRIGPNMYDLSFIFGTIFQMKIIEKLNSQQYIKQTN